jgi:hypothetical protein
MLNQTKAACSYTFKFTHRLMTWQTFYKQLPDSLLCQNVTENKVSMVYGQGPKNNSTVTSIKFYAQLRYKEGGCLVI